MEIGQKTNRLTLIGQPYRGYGLFRCECGTEKEIRITSVNFQETKSCGCLHKEITKLRATTHGKSKTRTHETWRHIKDRCLNKNVDCYKYYAGRGITMCEEWKKFENFYADMGERPEGMTLDRIDNEKGYYKENCRWATKKEQQNNTRRTKLFTYQGKTQSMKMWAEELGFPYEKFRARLKRGKTFEEALENKSQKRKYYEFNGESLTAMEWANKYNLKYNTVAHYFRKGKSINEIREICKTLASHL
jgi:hypothetical protein